MLRIVFFARRPLLPAVGPRARLAAGRAALLARGAALLAADQARLAREAAAQRLDQLGGRGEPLQRGARPGLRPRGHGGRAVPPREPRQLHAEMASTRLKALFTPLVDLIELLGALLVIGLGTWELSQGHLTLGGLLVFITYLTQLYSPIRGLSRLANPIYAASAGAERIIEFLDQRPSVVESPDARSTRPRRGRGSSSTTSASAIPTRERNAVSGVSFARRARRDAGAGRAERRGQVDAREAAAALLRPARRPGPARRPATCASCPRTRARQRRAAAPGDARLRRHGPREHRLRPPRRDARSRSRRRRAPPTRTTSSPPCPMATTRSRAEGPPAVGWPAPADRDRAGDDPRRAGADPRRADDRARRRVGRAGSWSRCAG